MAVAFQIAQLGDVVFVYNGHVLRHFVLHFRVEFQFVNANPVFVVGRHRLAHIKAFGKKAFHLFDAALVRSVSFHDFEENGDIQRNQRNDCGRTGHEAFIYGNVGFAGERLLQLFVDFAGSAFNILFGGTDGTVAVDGVSVSRADVGIGDRLDAFGENSR